MRILPVAYYCYAKNLDENDIYTAVKSVSSITHKHEISIMGCYIYVLFAIELLNKHSFNEAYFNIKQKDYSMFSDYCQDKYKRILKDEISDYDIDSISSSGYVVDTLEATLWCILTTNDFNSAIIKAINLGNDTDTIGACVGGLSGIFYGLDSINPQWIKDLHVRPETIILLKRKSREENSLTGLGKAFLEMTPKAQGTKANKNRWAYLKSFCIAKELINKMKRQPMEWEKICANIITKRLIFKIHIPNII